LPLLKGLAWSWGLTLVGGASFIGELRDRRWRYPAQLLLAAMLITLGVLYWP
jgi:hypothetical protein